MKRVPLLLAVFLVLPSGAARADMWAGLTCVKPASTQKFAAPDGSMTTQKIAASTLKLTFDRAKHVLWLTGQDLHLFDAEQWDKQKFAFTETAAKLTWGDFTLDKTRLTLRHAPNEAPFACTAAK